MFSARAWRIAFFYLCEAFKQKEIVKIYFNNFLTQLFVTVISLFHCVMSSDVNPFEEDYLLFFSYSGS